MKRKSGLFDGVLVRKILLCKSVEYLKGWAFDITLFAAVLRICIRSTSV